MLRVGHAANGTFILRSPAGPCAEGPHHRMAHRLGGGHKRDALGANDGIVWFDGLILDGGR